MRLLTRLPAALLASTALAVPALAQQAADAVPSIASVFPNGSSGCSPQSFGGALGIGCYDPKTKKFLSMPLGGNSFVAKGGTTILSLVRREFLTRPVYAADFGETCDGVSDNHDAYVAAAAYAVSQTRGLEFGAGACLVLSGTVPINGPLYDIGGKGIGPTNIQGRFDGPIFTWTVNGTMENFRVHDMTLSATFSPTPASYPKATTAIDLKGDSHGFVQHGQFDHLHLLGFYAGLTFEKDLPSAPDRFGLEGTVDWMAFADISCKTSTQDGQWCVWFKKGSGTGHTFANLRTTISGAGTGATDPSAAIRYDGPAGTVVGDQIVTGGQFGAVHAVISVGRGTVYRSNMSICASQLDAGTVNLFDLPNDGYPANRLNAACGNNMGGGVQVSYPPAGTSLVDDQLVDQRRAGVSSFRLGSSAARQGTPLFAIVTGSTTNSDFYGGTSCEIVVDGLIGGLAAGVTKASFLIPYGPGGYGAPVLDHQAQSTVSANFFGVSAAASNGTATFSVTYTAPRGGLVNDAQIVCRGGTYALKRLR